MNNRICLFGSITAFLTILTACESPRQPASRPSSSVSTSGSAATRPSIALPSMADTTPRDFPGIHNAVAYHDGYISGGVPEGDAGMDSLAAMGIRTIISVDGAAPDVEAARKRGMRYIHLPIGYNGFDDARKLQLARASRDAMKDGPVYIHCHHGKHRSAGAAGTVAASLGWITPDKGVERMKVSGTSPSYKGLYACTAGSVLLAASVVDAVSPDFPSVWAPTGLVKGMVEVDLVNDHLKLIEKAGWIAPKDHPDLVPAAEAGRLADLFRVMSESEQVRSKPDDFREMMTRGQADAQAIEDMLVAGEKDLAAIAKRFESLQKDCKACHVQYRD